METYQLTYLKIDQQDKEDILQFSTANLLVDTSDVTKSWFIDINQLKNKDVLDRFLAAADIRVHIYAVTADGKELFGDGYFYPNMTHDCAAIRGDDVLVGYDEL